MHTSKCYVNIIIHTFYFRRHHKLVVKPVGVQPLSGLRTRAPTHIVHPVQSLETTPYKHVLCVLLLLTHLRQETYTEHTIW